MAQAEKLELPTDGLTFTCHHCSNYCHVTRQASGLGDDFSGDVCGRWQQPTHEAEAPRPEDDLLSQRERLLLHHAGLSHLHELPDHALGIPRASLVPDLLPLWTALARTMGYNPTLSSPSTLSDLDRSAPQCAPLQLIAAQIRGLVDRGVSTLLLPSIPGEALSDSTLVSRVYRPEIHPDHTDPWDLLVDEDDAAEELDLDRAQLRLALQEGTVGVHRLRRDLAYLGRQLLEDHERIAVLIGRPCTLEALLHRELTSKLASEGLAVLPMDCLPTPRPVSDAPSHLDSAQLRAAHHCARDPRLFPVVLTSRGCQEEVELAAVLDEILAGRPRLFVDLTELSGDLDAVVEAFTRAAVAHPLSL